MLSHENAEFTVTVISDLVYTSDLRDDRPPVKPLTHVRDIVVLAFRLLNRAFGDQDDFWHPPNLGDLGQAGPA